MIRPLGPVPATCSGSIPALANLRRNAGAIRAAAEVLGLASSGSAAASASLGAVLRLLWEAINSSIASSATAPAAIMPINCPTGSSSPTSPKIRTSVPAVRASKLLTILSVSMSTISSPAETVSPTPLCQATIVPCVISIPHFGIVTGSSPSLIILSFCQRANGRHGEDHQRITRHAASKLITRINEHVSSVQHRPVRFNGATQRHIARHRFEFSEGIE